MKELWQLFIIFARIGGFTFGGGYAMLPMLQRELVDNKKWVTEEELLNYYAISQCTPGIIAVNTATFVGSKRRGLLGGIAATLGVIFPSLIIIMLIAALLQNFAEFKVVQNAFVGIRACVCALILDSVIKLGKKAIKDIPTVVVATVAFLLVAFFDISPIIVVLIAAVCGILMQGRKLEQ